DRGGFDCIVGNPPWGQFKPHEEDWFAGRAPEIAALRGADRKKAIAGLKTSDPRLHEQWQTHRHLISRLAVYARDGGRFVRSGTEANTYLLFTQLANEHVHASGRVGMLVKSALALDKSGQPVFQELLEQGRVEQIHDIVN